MDRLKEMLKRHEGFRRKKYLCTKKHWTIGVGWNLDANPLPDDIASFLRIHGYITDEMIERLLDISIETATDNCRDVYPGFDSFSENRRFALIDFMFNLGIGHVLEFVNTNRAINEGRWTDAAHGIKHSAYWKQLGGDPEGTDDGKLERPEEIAKMIMEG
jgi:lysozyme